MSRPAVSRQLRLLEDAGLVVGHSVPGDGRTRLYTINSRFHGVITAWLAGTEVGLTSRDPSAPAGLPTPGPRTRDPGEPRDPADLGDLDDPGR